MEAMTTGETASSVSRGRSLFIWGLCCALSGVVFLAYAGASLAAGRGEYVLPLDDVYIHFQYARQLAAGEPYVYNPGLPPTPIANPGAEAIRAAVNPDTTDYLFFVADGTGGHAFAETLDEHNENVARWRQIEAEQGAAPEGGVQGE